MKYNIAVTGNKGFVGTNLMNRLTEKYNVKGFDREDELDFKDINVVFHLACDGDSRNSNNNLVSHTENNLDLFIKVLNEAVINKVTRFVYISSVEAEEEKNLYAIYKRTCEKILQVICEENNIEWIIVRPTNLFGEYMDMENPNRNVVANFIKKVINGEEPIIIGDGNVTRKFTYVQDLIDILESCLTADSGLRLTCTSDIETSINGLKYMIENLYKTIKWVEKQ